MINDGLERYRSWIQRYQDTAVAEFERCGHSKDEATAYVTRIMDEARRLGILIAAGRCEIRFPEPKYDPAVTSALEAAGTERILRNVEQREREKPPQTVKQRTRGGWIRRR